MATDTRRPAGRQSRWGICTNPNCPNYRQKIEIERGDLICPEESCKKPLSPCAPPSKKGKGGGLGKGAKLAAIAVAAIAILAGGGYGIAQLFKGTAPDDYKISIDQKELTMKVGERAQLTPSVEPADAKVTYHWRSDNNMAVHVTDSGHLTAINAGVATITLSIEESDKPCSCCKVTVMKVPEPKEEKTQPEVKEDESKTDQTGVGPKPGEGQNPKYGTVDLGYATYTGDLKNGKPHGHGTMKFKSPHRINSEYTAERGDTYEGDFRDGRISGGMGYLNHNGDITAINP